MEHYLETMERAALAAAAHIVKVASSGETPEVFRKDDATLVTSIDLECERILFAELGTRLPILSEETLATHDLVGSSGRYFVIDPLDGTTACKRFLTNRGGQVGFGPIVGFAEDRRVKAAVFYNVPQRELYSAVRGEGVKVVKLEDPTTPCPPLHARSAPKVDLSLPLQESVLLYYMGKGGEAPIVEQLKLEGAVENAYRFGGFGNDCSRLASGKEELQFQLSVKPWDFPAILFTVETGMKSVLDPLGRAVAYDDWTIAIENPVLTAPPNVLDELLEKVRRPTGR